MQISFLGDKESTLSSTLRLGSKGAGTKDHVFCRSPSIALDRPVFSMKKFDVDECDHVIY